MIDIHWTLQMHTDYSLLGMILKCMMWNFKQKSYFVQAGYFEVLICLFIVKSEWYRSYITLICLFLICRSHLNASRNLALKLTCKNVIESLSWKIFKWEHSYWCSLTLHHWTNLWDMLWTLNFLVLCQLYVSIMCIIV